MSKSRLISFGTIAENRKARYNYEIKEKIQAGIILTGTEVKSLRLGKASISESYASETNGKLFLINSKTNIKGIVSSFFLIFYGSIRFIIEFYRQPDSHMGYIVFDTLSMGQILCIPMIIAGCIILVYSKKA